MRVGYVVGGLGRGGAELQLLHLASGLVRRGHEAHVLAYNGPSTLDDDFRAAGVAVDTEHWPTRVAKFRAVRAWLRRTQPDVVHGVMKRASGVTLLARLPLRRPPVVASDMSTATYRARSAIMTASLVSFGLADVIVTETDLNRTNLERLGPWLRGKTVVVRNGLDTHRFSPMTGARERADGVFRFCVVGTVYAVKNPRRVIEAVAELLRRGRHDVRVDWYGRLGLGHGDPTAQGEQAVAYARACGVERHVVFHGDTREIEAAYRRSDALLHASVQEGFPNAVAEGMACGLPVVVSRVADLPLVVAEARNGYVFDETDAIAMADAMERMMLLTSEERRTMGAHSRELAVRWFGMERFLDEFEGLYAAIANGAAATQFTPAR